jgi:hypothetical protein
MIHIDSALIHSLELNGFILILWIYVKCNVYRFAFQQLNVTHFFTIRFHRLFTRVNQQTLCILAYMLSLPCQVY